MKMELKRKPPLTSWHQRKMPLVRTDGSHSWLIKRWDRMRASWAANSSTYNRNIQACTRGQLLSDAEKDSERKEEVLSMKEAVTVPPWLLSLPLKKQLILTLGALVVSLGFYLLVFPKTFPIAALLLPSALVSWLFGWRIGLLCVAGITLLLGVGYGLASGNAFLISSWLLSWITATLSGLVIALMVGGLRRLTDALVGAQHQVAQIEQAYEHERELNQAQNQVLQTLNHEMRIPLTQVQGYLELLETCQTQLDPAMRAHFIAQANSGCEELLSLLTTALETAPGKSQPLHIQVFSLRHEVQTVLAHLDPHLLQQYRLHLDIPASLLIRADPRLVRQVMRNLLTNAFKYSPPHKHITVSAAPLRATEEQNIDAGKICVRVGDEGPGIPPEQQPLLFQRFVRLPNAIASGQPGTGLGLAICKQLVETMGGRIWLESPTRTGEGCCFSFTLTDASPSTITSNVQHSVGAGAVLGGVEDCMSARGK